MQHFGCEFSIALFQIMEPQNCFLSEIPGGLRPVLAVDETPMHTPGADMKALCLFGSLSLMHLDSSSV